ncbi:hypothetical protein PSN45_004090 [Yamadazyma tenuis]|uniref:uncharacterized protein n=1 Tax=Candida tenuis TaxID=2315449 RepID=UPI0027A44FBA|nr:hypothetical protein PSN45_004090 [Yamadazyma tenuis]
MLVNPLFYNQGLFPSAFFDNTQFVQQYSKPKLIKKIETDDEVKFQIFKVDGDFNSFEFKLIRTNKFEGLLEVFSLPDNFKVSIKLNLAKVDINNINFALDRYNSNVLNLIIPKYNPVYSQKPQEAFGYLFDTFFDQLAENSCSRPKPDERAIRQHRKEQKQEKLRREQERQEKLRREQERVREEQERIRKEHERIRQEQEKQARIRQEQERQARIIREKEQRLRKVREENLRKQRQEQEEARRQAQQQAQQFVNQIFQNIFVPSTASQEFPFTAFRYPTQEQAGAQANESSYSNKKAKPEVTIPAPESVVADPETSVPAAEVVETGATTEPEIESPHTSSPSTPEVDMTETASINSDNDLETPDSPLSDLHKHPSIEEVEDEEFVMLRKKFGQ